MLKVKLVIRNVLNAALELSLGAIPQKNETIKIGDDRFFVGRVIHTPGSKTVAEVFVWLESEPRRLMTADSFAD